LKRLVLPFVFALMLGAQSTPRRVAVPDDVLVERDITYYTIQGQRMGMDIARPKTPGPHPGVLLIHGGGFRSGSRDSFLPGAIQLARHGYVAATASYRLAPRFQFPALIHDVKTSVRFLRANAARFNLDGDYIGTAGASAGGTLALFLGVTRHTPEFEGQGPHNEFSSAVQCVVNLYGRSDLTTSYGGSRNAADVLPSLVGGELPWAHKEHLRASPLFWVTPSSAPVLSIHGTLDLNVPYTQSVALHHRLQSAGVDAELETIEGAGHGFKGADAERADHRMIEFFDKHLKRRQDAHTIVISDHGPGGEAIIMGWPSGRIHWRTPNDRGHDVQLLANGNVLLTKDPKGEVVEIDRSGKSVWSAGKAQGLERPLSAQRLENGNTLIGDAAAARVIEVDGSGKVVWNLDFPEYKTASMRMVRRTAAGTTLVVMQGASRVFEVNAAGKMIWQFDSGKARSPYQAVRMANGNTIFTLADPGEIIEVDSSGRIVRSIGGSKGPSRFGWLSGAAPLPNGNLLVADYTGRRLVELNPTGQIVHQLRELPYSIASISVKP